MPPNKSTIQTVGVRRLNDALLDAFAKIETRDLRVAEVTVPLRHFDSVVRKMEVIQDRILNQRQVDVRQWGAKVVPGPEFAVHSERGFCGCLWHEHPEECPHERDIRYRGVDPLDHRMSERVDLVSSGWSCYRPRIGGLEILVRSRHHMMRDVSPQERVALECLREMISEAEYRKYITHGFLLVKGDSGKTYQLYRENSHTKVWLHGKLLESLCVYIQEPGVPPTDNVIAFKTIIETDEEEYRRMANVFDYRHLTAAA